eukprot:TRINITY_DN8936_c0_g1_i2.p1 TRINITY_DN8936_c0_g1~~TRINITY_DN8936_c0_g1_i2.p1  ORF type:complete len:481 (+),score=68.61 TRINITY_DN8936_c0_g1_i2:104-1546(+)
MVAAVLRQEAEIGAIGWLPLQRLGAFGAGSVSEAGPTAPSALLVVLRRDGVVQLFKPSGEMVLRFYAGHMHPVVPALAVGTDAAEHLLLTADTSGGIKAHKLVVRPSRRLDNVPRGQRVKPETVYLEPEFEASHRVLLDLQLPRLQVGGSSSSSSRPSITAMTVVDAAGAKEFLVGDSAGRVCIFTRHGALREVLSILDLLKINTTVPVEGLSSHHTTLAYRSGTNWGLVDLDKLQERLHHCGDLVPERIHAAVFDAQFPHMLIVSDLVGDVWVINTKHRLNCKADVVFRSANASYREAASINGYLFALDPGLRLSRQETPATLMAYNLSHARLRPSRLARYPSPIVWQSQRPFVSSWAVHSNLEEGGLLAYVSADKRSVTIEELLMKVYPTTFDDRGSLNMPLLGELPAGTRTLIVAFVVFGLIALFQYCRPRAFVGRALADRGRKKRDVEEKTHDVDNNVFIDRLKQSARRAERQTRM